MKKAKLTPREVAERYGVNAVTVLDWIKNDLMPATDCSRSTATRKRYRMDENDLAEFERRRAAKRRTAEPRQRRTVKENEGMYV